MKTFSFSDVFPDWVIGVLLAFGGCALSNFGITMFKLAQMKQKEDSADAVETSHPDAVKTDHLSGAMEVQSEHEFTSPEADEKKPRIVCCHPIWILGMACCVLGAILDFASFAFASVSLLAPIGALTLIVYSFAYYNYILQLNMIMAPIFLNEVLTIYDVLCTLVILGGTVIALVFGSKNNATFSLSHLLHLYSEVSFLVYLAILFLGFGLLIFFLYRSSQVLANPKSTEDQISFAHKYTLFAFPTLGGASGAFSVLFAKSVVEMIKSASKGHSRDLANPFFFLFLSAIIVSIYLQVYLLNLGLELGDALFIVPVYQVAWVLMSTLHGLIYFRDLWDMTVLNVCLFVLGVIVTLLGVYLLSRRVESPGLIKPVYSKADSPRFAPGLNTNETDKLILDDVDDDPELESYIFDLPVGNTAIHNSKFLKNSLKIPTMGFLSSTDLNHLKSYHYASSHSGYLDRILLNPFWNYIVEFIPLWVAPNLLTLVSFLFAVASYAMLHWHVYKLEEEAPRWCYYVYAMCVFVYQTFDAIDGKQARRTKSGSPLGQLFDHGCDALNTWLTGASLVGTLVLGSSYFGMIFFAVGLTMFYTSNWEECQTGVMRFGLFSVSEAQFATIGLHVVTGIFGTDLWRAEYYGYSLNIWVAIGCLLLTFFSLVESIFHVISFYIKNKDYKKLFIACKQMFLFLSWILGWMAFAYLNYDSYRAHTRLYFALGGINFAYITSRLIISTVTASVSISLFTVTVYPLPLVLLSCIPNPALLDPMWLLYWYLALVFVVYWHFVISVIYEITSFLGIRVFVIKPII